MFTQINNLINWLDAVVWGLPLIILILFTGCLLTIRLGVLQIRHLGKALKFMIKNEDAAKVKYPVSELYVQPFPQPSVQAISSVLQLPLLPAAPVLFSGWSSLLFSVWRLNMPKVC